MVRQYSPKKSYYYPGEKIGKILSLPLPNDCQHTPSNLWCLRFLFPLISRPLCLEWHKNTRFIGTLMSNGGKLVAIVDIVLSVPENDDLLVILLYRKVTLDKMWIAH